MGNGQSEFKSQENTCELGFDIEGRYWGVIDGKSYNALFTPREYDPDSEGEGGGDTIVADLVMEDEIENQMREEQGNHPFEVEAYVGISAPDGSHEEVEEWDWIEPVSYGTHVEFEEITVPVSYKVEKEKHIGKIVLNDKAIFGNKPSSASSSRRNSREEIDASQVISSITATLPQPPKRRASTVEEVMFEATFSVPPSPPVVKSKLEAINSTELVVGQQSSEVSETRQQKPLLR